MKITIIAVGKLKAKEELALIARYQKRLPWKIKLVELSAQPTMEKEALRILDAVPSGSKLIALDERGADLSSVQLAKHVEQWQLTGSSHITIVIGGDEGLAQSVRDRADLILCFGALTWPHMLVRVLLMEQLYRIYSILQGHPYHRV